MQSYLLNLFARIISEFQIVIKCDNFIFDLYKVIPNDNDVLVNARVLHCRNGGFNADAKIENARLISFLDIETDFSVGQYDELLQPCNCDDFKETFDLVKKLIQQKPSHSELFRIKGQLES